MDSTAEQIRDLEDDLFYLQREIEDGLLDPELGQECTQAFIDRIAWKKELLAQERRASLTVLRRRPLRTGLKVKIARLTRPLRGSLGLTRD